MNSSRLSCFVLFSLSLLVAITGCREEGRIVPDAAVGVDSGPRPDVPGTDVPGTDAPGTDAGDCVPTVEMGMENTAALCSDGIDNDCNGFEDCRDFSCPGVVACAVENSNPACSDNEDNDGNGFTDCEDRNCEDRRVCSGATNLRCSDGSMSCSDEECQDEGIVVCDGATATGLTAEMWPDAIAMACTNGEDEDDDGRIDCGEFSCQIAHPACRDLPRENTNALCDDGLDNNMNGLPDCMDPGCLAEGVTVCREGETATPAEACSDEADNNDNTFIDCGDFGCQIPDVPLCIVEGTDATCSDGEDNDGNGFTDCGDFSCSQNPFVTVCETGFAKCSNGMDDDGNGFSDCADFSCGGPEGSVPRSAACL